MRRGCREGEVEAGVWVDWDEVNTGRHRQSQDREQDARHLLRSQLPCDQGTRVMVVGMRYPLSGGVIGAEWTDKAWWAIRRRVCAPIIRAWTQGGGEQSRSESRVSSGQSGA